MGGCVRTSPRYPGEDPTPGICFVKDAADYLTYIKALIVAKPQVVRCTVIREEAQGNMGLLRYRLTIRDGGMLEMFERFQVVTLTLPLLISEWPTRKRTISRQTTPGHPFQAQVAG